jgi:hypothetical protein
LHRFVSVLTLGPVPFSLLYLFAQGVPHRPAPPAELPNVTTRTAFEDTAEAAPPPLADDVARAYPFEPKASNVKPYDPAPLWLDRLFASLGSRPNYIVRDKTIDLAPCDARDMRCGQFHEDTARIEPDGAEAGMVASGIGTALGLIFGNGKDRNLSNSAKLRAKGRFVGIVVDW